MIFTYLLVFGVLLPNPDEAFATNLVIGVIVWNWFSNTVQHAMGSIEANIALINQVNINKVVFPLTVSIMDAIKLLPSFILLLLYISSAESFENINLIAIVLLMLIQFLFSFSLGLALAVIVPLFKDLKILVSSLLMMLLFVSGVFFTSNQIPYAYQDLFLLNPVALLIDSYRAALLEGEIVYLIDVMYLLLCSAVFLLFGLFTAQKLDKTYAKLV